LGFKHWNSVEGRTWGSEDRAEVTLEVANQSFTSDNVARPQHLSTGNSVRVKRLIQSRIG